MAVTMVSDGLYDTIATRFERQAAATPHNLAVVTDELSLTYLELDAMASRIAGGLALLPSDSDRPLALLMSEGPFLYAAVLGAAKAGRIFFVLTVTSPEPWLSELVAESGAAHILTDNSWFALAVRVAGTEASVLEVERIGALARPAMAEMARTPDAPACIVYTSGSTGRPKGVLLSHRGLLHREDFQVELLGLQQADRVANLRPTSTSAGLGNTLAPLWAGACVFPFDLQSRGLHSLAAWTATRKITGLSCACSLFRTWLAVLPGGCRLPSLRYVRVGGEPLYAMDVARGAQHLEGDWRICYQLSSTECATIAGCILDSSSQLEQGIIPVGAPTRHTEIRLENDAGEIIDPGEIGEIVIKSPLLALGYWKEPEWTATSFPTDPADGRRFFRTGDLGRWRSEGTLEHFGRKGRKVKVRGFSVEPFEVECELLRQPGISNAVVVSHQDAGKEALLIGYVAATSNISASTIRNALATRLPTHMVPSHVVVMDSLPTTASGKIDREALPPPNFRNLPLHRYRAAANEHERALVSIWEEMLKLSDIGMDDNFFDLGGTSLQALILFDRIKTVLSRDVPPSAILYAPTIAKLAELMRRDGTETVERLVPFRPSGGNEPLFFTPLGDGSLHYVRNLARDLKSNRPIYGLQPPPLDATNRILGTIESMATSYIAEMRRVQARGPYFLMGNSGGGWTVFEMAQQLVGEGELVSFLGMIDTILRKPPVQSRASLLNREVRRKIKELRGRRIPFHVIAVRACKGLALRTRLKMRDFRYLAAPWLNALHKLFTRTMSHTQQANYYDWLFQRAKRRYTPQPYPGHLTIFAAIDNSEWQRRCWNPLVTGGLTVLEVPSNHDEMCARHSKLLAEKIDGCLERLESRP
jgi:acyl-CoA synthetase (AMP-forming)/AMP-acid ligase II/thioesterase domain-containing protein